MGSPRRLAVKWLAVDGDRFTVHAFVKRGDGTIGDRSQCGLPYAKGELVEGRRGEKCPHCAYANSRNRR